MALTIREFINRQIQDEQEGIERYEEAMNALQAKLRKGKFSGLFQEDAYIELVEIVHEAWKDEIKHKQKLKDFLQLYLS